MSRRDVLVHVSIFCAVAAIAAGSAAPASADTPDCSTISGGAPIIYGAGGSGVTSLVGRIATVLENSSNPVFVVYKDDGGACIGLDALDGLGSPTLTGGAKYWDPTTGAKTSCNLPVEGATASFAVMGNGPLLCPLVTDPSYVDGILDYTGPVSTYNVLVPNASTQQTISAEAFYLIYGFGPEAGIAPWNSSDASNYLHRDENSAAQILMSEATGLPLSKFYGTDAGSSTNMVAYLAALTTPEAGIGFASGDIADANRATVRSLAWQHFDQNVGYWPDSSATAFDKVNVRDGQYFLWNPIHFFGLEGTRPGTFADANVQTFVEYAAGISVPSGATSTIDQVATANKNIPVCAMDVWRDGDLGAIYANPAEAPCGCYFEFTATGATSCTACDDSNPCGGSSVCRYGFCEAY